MVEKCIYFRLIWSEMFGWRRDRSVSGHSLTLRETISVCTTEINGAIAYEVSGNTFRS